MLEKLPVFNGENHNIFDWQEKVEDVMRNNGWNFTKLLQALPASLTGIAKRAFNELSDEDKRDDSALFLGLRHQIDPFADKKCRALFRTVRRGSGESMSAFISKLRTYIRRSGNDPSQPLIRDMLRDRVYENLPTSNLILLK